MRYARLGVSPHLPTEEIKEVINRKRRESMRRRRARADQQFGEEEAEMTRLQAIEDEIGTPRARVRYDRLNPQNALLTVQPAPADARLEAGYRAGLVTAWLIEQLGRDHPLPSAEALFLWAPLGIDSEVRSLLSSLAGDRALARRGEADGGTLPDVSELLRWGQPGKRPRPPAPGRGSGRKRSRISTVGKGFARWLNITA